MTAATTTTMPYNTRRKSLSLAELGITVPKRARSEAQHHPSPPSTIVEGDEPPVKKSKRSHPSASPPSSGLMSPPQSTTPTRAKKDDDAKRLAALSPPPSPARDGGGHTSEAHPHHHHHNQVDVEGIHDEVVVAAIRQLEKTGNRPHLVKELALVLAPSLPIVEKSANASALISSRLTAYLARPWPAVSPCPLAKDLSPVHPRRLYFFLTTMPHQPIPDVAESSPKAHRIISPSLSSASAADDDDDDDERYNRRRAALSPSPEVDLSSPELDDDGTQEDSAPSFPARSSMPRDASRSSSLSHQRRAASPQLEREERDFKQTANQLYEQAQLARRSGQDKQQPPPPPPASTSAHQQHQQDVSMDQADAAAAAGGVDDLDAGVTMSIEETEEAAALRHSDDAAALFGQADYLKEPSHFHHHHYHPHDPHDADHAHDTHAHIMDFSSPVLHPQPHDAGAPHFDAAHGPASPRPAAAGPADDVLMEPLTLDLGGRGRDGASKDPMLPEASFAWDSLQSPENIELAELDDMFDAY